MGEGRSVGGGNDFGAGAHPGADVMQLAGIDHVQALFTDTLEAWQNFSDLGLHHTLTAFISGEIKIEKIGRAHV